MYSLRLDNTLNSRGLDVATRRYLNTSKISKIGYILIGHKLNEWLLIIYGALYISTVIRAYEN